MSIIVISYLNVGYMSKNIDIFTNSLTRNTLSNNDTVNLNSPRPLPQKTMPGSCESDAIAGKNNATQTPTSTTI